MLAIFDRHFIDQWVFEQFAASQTVAELGLLVRVEPSLHQAPVLTEIVYFLLFYLLTIAVTLALVDQSLCHCISTTLRTESLHANIDVVAVDQPFVIELLSAPIISHVKCWWFGAILIFDLRFIFFSACRYRNYFFWLLQSSHVRNIVHWVLFLHSLLRFFNCFHIRLHPLGSDEEPVKMRNHVVGAESESAVDLGEIRTLQVVQDLLVASQIRDFDPGIESVIFNDDSESLPLFGFNFQLVVDPLCQFEGPPSWFLNQSDLGVSWSSRNTQSNEIRCINLLEHDCEHSRQSGFDLHLCIERALSVTHKCFIFKLNCSWRWVECQQHPVIVQFLLLDWSFASIVSRCLVPFWSVDAAG